MKKITNRPSFIALMVILFLFTSAYVAERTYGASAPPADKIESVSFSWEQPTDLASLQGWNIYSGDAPAGPWTKFLNVPYTGGIGPTFTGTGNLTVTGVAGATVKKWFSATSVNKDGKESTYATGQPTATEVTKNFLIPYASPIPPANFRTTGNVLLVPKP